MIVAVAATKVKTTKVMFLVFCSDCNSSNGKVNKREPVYGKLVGTGLRWIIMPDAVRHVTVIT